ncbi:hypothetical protein FOZ63_015205, partial [Perkinsus olseni]
CASANPSTMGFSTLEAAMLTEQTSGGYVYNPKQQQPTAHVPSLRGTPFGMSYVEAESSAMGGRCDAASFAATDLYKNATTASASDQLPCMFEGWAGLIDALERTFGLVPSPVGRREVDISASSTTADTLSTADAIMLLVDGCLQGCRFISEDLRFPGLPFVNMYLFQGLLLRT